MKKIDLTTYLTKLNSKKLKIIGPFYSGPRLEAENIIYVDAGTNFKTTAHGFSVGDNDSYTGFLDETLSQEKNFSDLAYVLSCIHIEEPVIELLGFRGGRADHDLINLAEVHRFLKRTPEAIVQFDNGITAYSSGPCEFEFTGIFSVFAFDKVNIQIAGACKYKINSKDEFQELSSHGLSNVAEGLVTVECDGPFFVFKNHIECDTNASHSTYTKAEQNDL